MSDNTRASLPKAAPTSRNLVRALAASAAILFACSLVACEPGSRRKQTPLAETAEFQQAIEKFEWPATPSHVIALELEGRGTIRLGLYDQVAPKTVAHVVECVSRGVYDDTLFHRVIKDFMIQGGDPSTRKRGPDSTPGNWGRLSVEDEYRAIHHDRGVIALANRGRPGSAASQFFIVHRDSHNLDGKYTAFGRVLAGMEVVDAIAEIETDVYGRWGEKDSPLEKVILTRAVVESGAVESEPAETRTPSEPLGIAQSG